MPLTSDGGTRERDPLIVSRQTVKAAAATLPQSKKFKKVNVNAPGVRFVHICANYGVAEGGERRGSSAKPMADCPDLDLQLVVEAPSVDRSEVVAGLLKIPEDLRTGGAALKSLDVFIDSL
jgi:hypothetical protein